MSDLVLSPFSVDAPAFIEAISRAEGETQSTPFERPRKYSSAALYNGVDTISDVIFRLQAIRCDHGDLPVRIYNYELGFMALDIEVNVDDGSVGGKFVDISARIN